MEIGQEFESKSKVQKNPVRYIYRGQTETGRHYLEADGPDRKEDCEVDAEWFNNRKITMLDPCGSCVASGACDQADERDCHTGVPRERGGVK